jgi:hypothetical protein
MIIKPNPPNGYRMLEEGKDKTSPQDQIRVKGNPEESSNTDSGQHWARCFRQGKYGLVFATDTAVPYKAPTKPEDYCFYRCRKYAEPVKPAPEKD